VLARESNETKTNPNSAMKKEINSTREAKRGATLEREINPSTSVLEREITQAQDRSNQEQESAMLYGALRLNHLYKNE
jgi:hypothetical protein